MSEEKNEHKYNGWANYETWAVKLWLRSSRSSRSYWTEQARELHGSHTAVDQLSDQLKDKLIDASPLQEPSVYADLLNAALSKVDWYELARSYLDQLDEEKSSHEKPSDPEREDAENLFGKVIFAYTRKQAIADGVLVDVSETAKEAGFKIPVALTHAVWAEYVVVPEGVQCQDEAGRLWDILWMCLVKISRSQNRDSSETLFQLHVRNDNHEGEPPLVTLKAHCGPADDSKPVLTIMLPDED
jgi:hypothetical protein